MGRADLIEWLEPTVVELPVSGLDPVPPPSPFDDVTEVNSDLHRAKELAQAETGPAVVVVEDVLDASDGEDLPVLDPAEFEAVGSLVASIGEPSVRSKLSRLVAKLSRLVAIAAISLRPLWSSLKSSTATAIASLQELTARLPHHVRSIRVSDVHADARPLLAERHARRRVATIAVWAAAVLGACALGGRLLSLLDF